MAEPRFINRTKLPPSAFRCVIEGCGAISGKCEHTDPKKNPGFKVRVAGIITGTHQRMDQVIVMGPVTPMPMRMPKTSFFERAYSYAPTDPETKTLWERDPDAPPTGIERSFISHGGDVDLTSLFEGEE